jgi:hypothetical protein
MQKGEVASWFVAIITTTTSPTIINNTNETSQSQPNGDINFAI